MEQMTLTGAAQWIARLPDDEEVQGINLRP